MCDNIHDIDPETMGFFHFWKILNLKIGNINITGRTINIRHAYNGWETAVIFHIGSFTVDKTGKTVYSDGERFRAHNMTMAFFIWDLPDFPIWTSTLSDFDFDIVHHN